MYRKIQLNRNKFDNPFSLIKWLHFDRAREAVHVDNVIYDEILGQLTKEEDKACFKITKDAKKGNVSNILTIVLPLKLLDEILNVLGNTVF